MDEVSKGSIEKDNKMPGWVKSGIAISVTGVLSYKIIRTPVHLDFDFPSFLALVLAMFSVGLAAMFYFKATDSSNKFYDNTYKFTQDIANLLVRIESGFGEKLRHLDEAYTGIQEKMDTRFNPNHVDNVREEVKDEEKELEKLLAEKERIIKDLVNGSALQDEEKERVIKELKQKDEELSQASEELRFLKRRLHKALRTQVAIDRPSTYSRAEGFLKTVVPELLGEEFLQAHPRIPAIQERWKKIVEELPDEFLHDMKLIGYQSESGELSPGAIRLIRSTVDKR